MRVLVTATMAVSALAIGLGMDAAQSLSPGGPLGDKIGRPDASVQLVQQKEKGMGQGPGMGGGPGKGGAGPSMQDGGGGKSGGMRQGGSQFRSGEKSLRGERGGGEFGYRERRERGYGERDRDRRRGGAYFRFGPSGPSFGYGPARGCGWLRQRALETDSPYWWRRYRACRGG